MSHSQQRSWLQSFFLELWYGKRWWIRVILWLLLPLSWLYQILAHIDKRWQKKRAVTLSVPVVVVGNISVGGTGKTPIIISLANALKAKGVSVGIISRGYGSHAPSYPYLVTSSDQAVQSGDEPLLIAKATQCPVMIDKNRVAAGQALLRQHPEIQLILSDDGLQHHTLERDIEIVVVDSERGLGNHFCLPVGPLREPAKRLATVDWILLNTPAPTDVESSQEHVDSQLPIKVSLQPQAWRHIATQEVHPLMPYPWDVSDGSGECAIHAVAGIGNPQRFFNTLAQLDRQAKHSHGQRISEHSFDDHYQFSATDFSSWTNDTVLMTEKDGVKCQALISESAMPNDCWSLIVDISLPDELVNHVASLIRSGG